MSGLIMYYTGINPFSLNDDDFCAAYKSLEWILAQQNKINK